MRLAGGELSRSFLSDGKKETARLFNDELKQIGQNDKYVALAYVGTANKQMFTYPKADFAKDYDPTNRTWYKISYTTFDLSDHSLWQNRPLDM